MARRRNTASAATPTIALEVRATDSLTAYEHNAKIHSSTQVAQIAESIKVFGFNDPIGITPEGVILEGEGRWLAAKRLVMPEVPVIVVTGLSEKQYGKYRIAHNQFSQMTGIPRDKLLGEMEALLKVNGITVQSLGLTATQYDRLSRIAAAGGGPIAPTHEARGGQYEIIFDDADQRRAWMGWLRRLLTQGNKQVSHGARVIAHIEQCGVLGNTGGNGRARKRPNG